MPARLTRKFSLLDVMVLVAATAAGLAASRSFGNFSMVLHGVVVYRSAPDGRGDAQYGATSATHLNRSTVALYSPKWKGQALYWSTFLDVWPVPGLTAWTLATFGLGLRRARRRPARRPGMAAGLAVLVAIVASATRCPALLIRWPSWPRPKPTPVLGWGDWWLEFWVALPRAAGLAVVVAWVILALSGRWAAEPTWLDRLGRSLGACWIGIAAIGVASDLWQALPY